MESIDKVKSIYEKKIEGNEKNPVSVAGPMVCLTWGKSLLTACAIMCAAV